MATLCKGKQLNHFHFFDFSQWGSTLKGEILLPRKKFFPLRIAPLLKDIFLQGGKEEITKVVLLHKNCMTYESGPFYLNYP